MEDDRKFLKEMADLLRDGATMLAQSCPICNVPLFRLRSGVVICPSCKRHVIFESESSVGEATSINVRLKETLSKKLSEIISRIESVEDEDELLKLVELARRINELLKEVGRG